MNKLCELSLAAFDAPETGLQGAPLFSPDGSESKNIRLPHKGWGSIAGNSRTAHQPHTTGAARWLSVSWHLHLLALSRVVEIMPVKPARTPLTTTATSP